MTSIEEEWLPVTGYEGIYEVSNLGRVQSLDREDSRGRRRKGKVLSPGMSNGYLRVTLCDEGGRWSVVVHTLVADAFLGERPDDLKVIHIDNDLKNNSAVNLRYVPHAEVMWRNSTFGLVGKLSPNQVREIRDEFGRKPYMKVSDYAKEHDLDARLVHPVVTGRTRTPVKNTDGTPGRRARKTCALDGELVAKMRSEGHSMQKIADQLGREVSGVYRAYYKVSRPLAEVFND